MHAACAPTGAHAGPLVELADVVRSHGAALRARRVLTSDQYAALRDIERCRTAELGGHLDVCARCGHERPSYNSCRNRHCPKCQALAQARWVGARSARLLPASYFHVVFTLPAELRALTKLNRRVVFDAMLAAAGETLVELGLDPKRLGALLGATCVLHTWTRDLRFHPHVHCIVTGGGWSAAHRRWVRARSRYLFPLSVLAALFRAKLIARLRSAHRAGELRSESEDPEAFDRLCITLHRKLFIVYAKRPFGGAEHVVRYLGRYTHRVGISNQRLVSFDARGVTFRTKHGKTVTLDPVDFLDRFVEHVLPSGFVKIRHYGLLAPSNVRSLLDDARGALGGKSATPTRDMRDLLLALTGIDVSLCPACGARELVRQPLPTARAPPTCAA